MDISFVQGSGAEPLKYETIGRAFDETARRFSSRDALIVPSQQVRWSYAELKHRADSFAAGLLSVGLAPGDRLGIWAPNCAEWVVTQIACAKIGLILVNINPAYRLSELEFCLKKVGCRALVSAERLKNSDYIAMLRSLAPELDHSAGQLNSARLPHLKVVIRLGRARSAGFLNFEDVVQRGSPSDRARVEEIGVGLQPDDAINIQFTSGTTGLPKGATLSHYNILNNGYFVGRGIGLNERDRICIPVPLYHCFGMVMGNLAAIAHGAAMIYPAESFDPAKTLETVDRERATALYGVPTMFIAELETPEFKSYDLSSLRTGIMAGSPCPVEVMKRVISQMNLTEITNCYGMTETSPVSFQTATDDSFERRVSTVGRVHPHVQVKIVDPEGRCVPRGVQGEIHTRGYSVMKGYWEDPERTREVLDEAGWMHTGDLGVIDPEGYGNVTGRLKDMIIRGGENVYPREIEEFLYRHAKVQAVQVCGVPDPRFGEEVCAWIQLKPGAAATVEEILEFCQNQIAHYKIPRHIRFVSEFPMTITGKVQKFAMRETMVKELGLSEERTA
ncbi:MAG TPA: AMP-binding protein [Steroidobacteraceae bacterium]|nr:AMP-binding protein [Steroidobacteraceae bacterium]